MIVGGNPHRPAIGDIALLRAENRRTVGQSSTQTPLDTTSIGATERAKCPGMPASNWLFPESTSDSDSHVVEAATVPGTALALSSSEVDNMEFHIGDKVRVGSRVGAITDVGTVLIQVKTTEGGLRVFCPWELVKTRDDEHGSTQVAHGCQTLLPAEHSE